jgi:hypothetical protein
MSASQKEEQLEADLPIQYAEAARKISEVENVSYTVATALIFSVFAAADTNRRLKACANRSAEICERAWLYALAGPLPAGRPGALITVDALPALKPETVEILESLGHGAATKEKNTRKAANQ